MLTYASAIEINGYYFLLYKRLWCAGQKAPHVHCVELCDDYRSEQLTKHIAIASLRISLTKSPGAD